MFYVSWHNETNRKECNAYKDIVINEKMKRGQLNHTWSLQKDSVSAGPAVGVS